MDLGESLRALTRSGFGGRLARLTRKHQGPGKHPSGTPQSTHGKKGRKGKRGRKAPLGKGLGRGHIAIERVVAAMHEEAKRLDEIITPKFEAAVKASRGKAVGLEFRIKQNLKRAEEKLAEKIIENTSIADPREHLHDLLRYTVTWPHEQYASGRATFLAEMEKSGFTLFDSKNKNYWNGEFYRGDNYVFQHESGFTIEMQMHTPRSWKAKEAQHKIYEEHRSPGTSPSRKAELEAEMARNWAEVITPNGALDVGRVMGAS